MLNKNIGMKRIVLILSLIAELLAASAKANYPLMTDIKSGEHKLTLSTLEGPVERTYEQSYFVTFTEIPNIAIGIMVFEAETTDGEIGFTVEPR